jgi:hypothetical protein
MHIGPDSVSPLSFDFAAFGWLDQSKEHDLFAGGGADVVVKAQRPDTRDLLDHRFHERPRRFEHVGADLFEQISPLFRRKRFDQLLLGGGQNAMQPDDEKIAKQVGMDGLGAHAHVLLFEVRNPFAHRGFDFTLRFHDNLPDGWLLDSGLP